MLILQYGYSPAPTLKDERTLCIHFKDLIFFVLCSRANRIVDIVSKLTLFQQLPKSFVPRFIAEFDIVHVKGEEVGNNCTP